MNLDKRWKIDKLYWLLWKLRAFSWQSYPEQRADIIIDGIDLYQVKRKRKTVNFMWLRNHKKNSVLLLQYLSIYVPVSATQNWTIISLSQSTGHRHGTWFDFRRLASRSLARLARIITPPVDVLHYVWRDALSTQEPVYLNGYRFCF